MSARGRVDTFPARRGDAWVSSAPLLSQLHKTVQLFLLLLIVGAACFSTIASSQENKPGVVGLGDLVVTGFSRTLAPPANLPPGASEIDERFIDPGGASLKVFDVSNPGSAPEAQILNASPKFQAFARDIGQVFGLALDDNDPPGIYATATSVHGLQIVVPDADGDGRPERIKVGQPGATWMDGQFGTVKGGGPGTVWKIDGETGEVSRFAAITGNTGAGLGNIAFDPGSQQLFVSDLDTGLIHRLDMNGSDLDTFDHGLQGRPANGMNATPDDGAQADITNPAFDAEDSGTWGLTPPERRVWGLAVHKDRLYYAVEDGPQVWSVGINEDGSFGSDPRWELDVPADPDALPVSDIAFQSNGRMLLAQRGGISSRYDYSRYHQPRKARVMRFSPETPDDPNTPSLWAAEPEDYAIGFPGNYRNASGGIAIGYGYRENADGTYAFGSCEGTVWSTGDALRDNPVHGAQLSQGGPLNVHGLQGNALNLVRPENEPPRATYFVDYDGQFEDPQASGHVGDVEIPRKCGGQRSGVMDLRIYKRAQPERCEGGADCPFAIEIANTGTQPYEGPLVIQDIAHSGAQLVDHAPPAWDCSEAFPGAGFYQCEHPGVSLAPGESTVLELTFQTPGWWDRPVYDNCAELIVPGAGVDERLYNNRSCDYVASGDPGVPGEPDLQLEKYGRYGACDFFGVCEFSVIIVNVGAAPYTGQLQVSDFATTAGATMIDWSPKPDWNCAATGPDSYGCSTAGPVTLSPGEFRELVILVQGPPVAPGFSHVRNCALIDWDSPPGDYNPHNEFACAEIENLPPGHPDARPTVSIQKDAEPTCSRAGVGNPWSCLYAVRIKNSGTAPLDGPIAFTDEVTAHPATLLGWLGGPGAWACVPGVGAAGPYTCTHPPIAGGLLPGDEVGLLIGFELPAATPVPSWELNCGTIQWDNDGDGADEDHEACALALVCDAGSGNCPQDLAVLKTPPAGSCPKSGACQFSVQVKNLANVNFPGPVTVEDVPAAGAGPANVLTPGWACAPAGGSYSCTNPAAIPPGTTANFSIDFQVPAGYVGNTFENCAKVPPGPGNDFAGNDEDCAVAVVPQPLPADLGPWSDTTCRRGQKCTVPARIDNKGEQTFTGSAGVSGTLSPELQITGITSKTSGLSCRKSGNATYVCLGEKLSIEGGGAVEYEITVQVPQDYPHSEVSHIKSMIWPDQKVKDRNSKNDQHTSIITIEQPPEPEPEPTPPPQPAGTPDFAVSKSAMQQSCNGRRNCNFRVTVRNIGNAAYSGPVTINDTVAPGGVRFIGHNPKNWNCSGRGSGASCTNPNVNLASGASTSLILSFAVPLYDSGTVNNCVVVSTGSGVPRSGDTIRDVQAALSQQGIDPGPIDGQLGPQTIQAVREYQQRNGLPANGRIDAALLNSLFGQPGDAQDGNPSNNRACSSVTMIGEARPEPPPQPQPCTGGRVRNSQGQCVCPSSRPVWTGSQCILRPPQPCSGDRVRNSQGQCVCPSDKPVWTGQTCVPRGPEPCSGGRVRNNQGQCVCPSSRPVWTGAICVPAPQGCSGGRIRNNKGQCVCPPNNPVWTGQQCISRPTCSGGRFYNPQKKACECPPNKPFWNGRLCTQQTISPPPSEITPTPTPQPTCSGGRIRNSKGQCVCPPNKPQWTGKQCIPRVQINPPGGGGLQINPDILKKIPGIKIQ